MQPRGLGQPRRLVGEAVRRRPAGRRHRGHGRSPGSRRGCGGSPAPGCGRAGRRRAARSARRGRSPRPRSPRAASASLRPISWVAIDLTLTTSSTPCACATSATIAQASSASRAQCTVAPRAVSDASSWTQVLVEVQQRVVLDRRAGDPQLLPVLDLGDDRGPLGADRRRWRGRGCGAAGCRPARRAPPPGRPASRRRSRLTARRTCAVRRWRREDLGEVHHPDAGPLPRQHPADVHQAGVVAGDQHLGAGLAHVPGLVRAHRHRGVGVLHREGAAEPAALLGRRQVDQLAGRAPPAAAAAAGRRRRASAASGRSGGRSPCAGSTRRRRSRRARRRGTRSARRSAATSPATAATSAGVAASAGRRSRAGAAPTRRTTPTASTMASYPANASTKVRTTGTASSR